MHSCAGYIIQTTLIAFAKMGFIDCYPVESPDDALA
jgi:hypothetical protein